MSVDPLLSIIIDMSADIGTHVPYHPRFQQRFDDQWHILSTVLKIDPVLRIKVARAVGRPDLLAETGLSKEIAELAVLAAIVMKR